MATTPKIKELLTNPLGVTPGIGRRMWVARKSELNTVPQPAAISETTTYEELVSAAAGATFGFKTGFSFVAIDGIADIVFDDGAGGEKGSTMLMPKLTVTFQRTKAAEGFRSLIANDELIVLFKDADASLRQLGSLDFPARSLPGSGVINNTEKRLVVELEAGPTRIAALFLPDNFSIPLTPAAAPAN